MIERFAELIPESVRSSSGAAFYSGRAAFGAPSPLYILGLNPGGDDSKRSFRSVEQHTRQVLEQSQVDWSAYRDERWGPNEARPGTYGLQPRVLHLLRRLGLNPGRVPSSNLIFTRTKDERALGDEFERLAKECWLFHEAVMRELEVKVILCFGKKAGDWIARRLDAHREVGRFIETNDRYWPSVAKENGVGQVVVIATHPTRANWQNPDSDPTPLLRRFLSVTS